MKEKKIISSGKVKNKGIIDDSSRKLLEKKIRNNYSLFGDKVYPLVAYCIELYNYSKVYNNISDNIDIIKYIITKDKDENLDCKFDKSFNDNNIAINRNNLRIKNSYDKYLGPGIDNSNNYNIIFGEDNFKGYIQEAIDEYNNGSNNIDSYFSINFNESDISIESETVFSETYFCENMKNITYCSMPENIVNINTNSIAIIVLFVATKCVPLIRIYNTNKDAKLENIKDLILNFEDKNCIYNSYFSKYNYYKETKKLDIINLNTSAMKYDKKIEDIINYLNVEQYIEDPIVYNIQYNNENGISAEYFERDSELDNCIDTVKRYIYKGFTLFEYIISKSLKNGNIECNRRINIKPEEYEKVKNKDLYNLYIEKFKTLVSIVNYAIIPLNMEIIFDKFDTSSYKVIHSTIDDRIEIYSSYYYNKKYISMDVELFNNDQYALVRLNIIESENLKDIITLLFDRDECILFINKHIANYGQVIYNKRKNTNVRLGYDSFVRKDIIKNNYKMIEYYGIEGKFNFNMNNKKIININSFYSPIYSINDEFFYIRDEYGVPEKIYLK